MVFANVLSIKLDVVLVIVYQSSAVLKLKISLNVISVGSCLNESVILVIDVNDCTMNVPFDV